MTTSCLFLKPQVIADEEREKQIHDIKMFIRPAIEHCALSVIDGQIDGLEVADISDDVVRKIFKADVLVIDANWYPTSGLYQLSPYLYYCMAVGHSRGNATILVADTTMYLSHTLVRHHTLVYSAADSWMFTLRFSAAVNEIRERLNTEPDNPIQDCLKKEKIEKVRQRASGFESGKIRIKQVEQPLIFHPVEKDWE
jgi:hypothetical protein